MSDALLATQMALAREQKLTDLGGVVAAAAHELGTPLATIKLVSSELMDELGDTPELADDARLIRDQADRCRDILRSMGRAGKDDLHLRRPRSPRSSARRLNRIWTAARRSNSPPAPAPAATSASPACCRKPEIIHGLRNLIQNAVDFATTDRLGRRRMERRAPSPSASPMTGRAIRPRSSAASATRSSGCGAATKTAPGARNTKAWGWACSSPRPCWNGRAPSSASPTAPTRS